MRKGHAFQKLGYAHPTSTSLGPTEQTATLPMFIPRRLDKYLSETSTLPLRKLRLALSEGRVEVKNGNHVEVEREGNRLVFEDDEVCLDGAPLSLTVHRRTYLLNKPKGVTSTTRDPKGKQDLSVWLKQLPAGVFPVGRLDRDSTGALLLTNDGDLASILLSPTHKTTKTYWLWLDENIDESDPRLVHFRRGVTLPNGELRATGVAIESRTEDYTELIVELQEGKNRQLRRMCRAVDFRLLHLHRRSIACIQDQSLALGQLRELSYHEVLELWDSTGGKAMIERQKVEALVAQARRARISGRPLSRLEVWLTEESIPISS